MMENQESITLQLHYFFSNTDSHSMNARIHNECDKQFIQAIQLINKYLDDSFELEVLAKDEGGIKDLYKILIKNPLVLIILTALITSAANQFFISNYAPAINVTEETKNKLENIEKIKEIIKSGNLTDKEFDYIIENDRDLRKLKSNFFKSAKKEKTINLIEVEASKQDKTPIFEKKSISFADFDNCILTEEQEKKEIEIDAKIYIVSPILIRGRKDLWKGLSNDEPIEFRVSDKIFLENVYQHIIKFSNGTYINCKIRIVRTTSSIDEKEKISREVFDISSWGDDIANTRTLLKKKKKSSSNDSNNNEISSLFSDSE